MSLWEERLTRYYGAHPFVSALHLSKKGRSSTTLPISRPSILSILSHTLHPYCLFCIHAAYTAFILSILSYPIMSAPAATREQQLIDLFSDFSMDFFRGQPPTSSDVGGLTDFNMGVLIELKGLGLFSLFKEFKEFLQMGVYKDLMRLSCLADLRDPGNATTLSTTCKAWRESIESIDLAEFVEPKEMQGYEGQEGFEEFEGLGCLWYFSDFKLLLCSSCSLAINPLNIRGHLLKHCPSLKGKEKKAFVSKAMSFITSSLEVSSLRESHFLILLASALFPPLRPFKGLRVKGELYACSLVPSCCAIRSSLYHIKRHIREGHKPLLSNKDMNRCHKVIASGQALEENRFFFSVATRGKGKGREEQRRAGGDAPLPMSPSASLLLSRDGRGKGGERETLDPFELASSLFLEELAGKEDAYCSSEVPFSLSKQEKYSTFQTKTKYLEFIASRDRLVLKGLVAPLLQGEEEGIIGVLADHLKEVLYLSLEKSLLLNRVHLNLLNSFQLNVTRNKGFKPLLEGNSRVLYFNFFASFLAFLLRSYRDSGCLELKLYTLPPTLSRCLRELEGLAALKLEDRGGGRGAQTSLHSIRKSVSHRLNKLKSKDFDLSMSSDSGEGEGGEDTDRETGASLASSSHSSSIESIGSNDSIESASILERVASLSKDDDATSTSIKKKLLGLLVSLLRQETNLYLFKSAIHSFFACKSIREDLSIRDSLDFSQLYSKFIYCSQLIVIEYAFSHAISRDDSSSLTSVVRDMMSSCFHNSAPTPLGEILNNRSYCFKVNKELSSLSNVIISLTSKETVSYKKVTVSVDDLRHLFKEAILSLEQGLREKLLLGMPSKEYEHVSLEGFSAVEDASNTTPYKCFRDFHPTSPINNALIRDYILKTPLLRGKVFKTSRENKLVLDLTVTKAYLRDVKEFLKLCLLVIHLTSGLPLRGTELTTLRFLNSYKDKREMFLDKASHLFILNISYYKGKEQREKETSNIRYLCREASRVFLLYITLVSPFVGFLNLAAASSPSSYKRLLPLSCYFFHHEKQVLTSRELSIRLSTFTNLVLGQRIGIQVYRQLIVAVIREFMGEALNRETLALEGGRDPFKDIRALQMNHSTSVEELHYGRSASTFSNVREGVQRRYLEFCLRFFSYFHISDLDINSHPFASALRDKEMLDRSLEGGLQKGVGAMPALRFYKGLASSCPPLGPSRKHLRGRSSITSALQDDFAAKRVRLEDLNNMSSSLTSTSTTLLCLLREFLSNPVASFKVREQELLVKAILLKVPYVLAILPTNSGKSLSYLLTSSLATSHVSIIILPLVGLKQDIIRRAGAFNVPCSIYEGGQKGRGGEDSNLTLVSIESIVREDFVFYLQRLIEEGRLDRIVVDECHLLLSSSNYRSIVYRFVEILLLPTQFVFLTGTLPFSYEVELKETLKLQSLSVIRAPTSRGDISYNTRAYSSLSKEDHVEEVRSYVESYRLKLRGLSDKILIFCPTISSIVEMGDAIGCPVYYSSLKGKEEVLQDFLQEDSLYSRVLVSSSALEEGLDYSSIRLVVYKDSSYSFLSFLQGSGRGGRDGKKSTSMFFHSKGEEEDRASDSLGRSTLRKYLREGVCKRRVIASFLDDSFIDKCSREEEPCSCCLSRQQTFSSTISAVKSSSMYVERNREEFKARIKGLSSSCIYCSLLQKPLGHITFECPLSKEINKAEWPIACSIKDRKRTLLKADSCCFSCFLPTTICSTIKREQRGVLTCYNLKLVTRVISLFWHKQEELGIKGRFAITSALKHYDSFLPIFFTKVFLKDLNTEGVLGVKVLLELLCE